MIDPDDHIDTLQPLMIADAKEAINKLIEEGFSEIESNYDRNYFYASGRVETIYGVLEVDVRIPKGK